MPVIPGTANAPYDVVNDILNATRSRVNDQIPTLVPVSGKLLDLSQASTQQYFNDAWRRTQDALSSMGFMRLTEQVDLTGFPPLDPTALDPATEVYLTWAGSTDGVTIYPTPALPGTSDPSPLLYPLKLWERPSGMNAGFSPMTLSLDAMWTQPKQIRQLYWIWRNDMIVMPGCTSLTDIRVLYATYIPDFLDSGTQHWYEQQVPIARVRDVLAWEICAELALARGEVDLEQALRQRATDSCGIVMNRDIRQKQRRNTQRIPYIVNRYYGDGVS